jgi:hypothetical protein
MGRTGRCARLAKARAARLTSGARRGLRHRTLANQPTSPIVSTAARVVSLGNLRDTAGYKLCTEEHRAS